MRCVGGKTEVSIERNRGFGRMTRLLGSHLGRVSDQEEKNIERDEGYTLYRTGS